MPPHANSAATPPLIGQPWPLRSKQELLRISASRKDNVKATAARRMLTDVIRIIFEAGDMPYRSCHARSSPRHKPFTAASLGWQASICS